jgi:hypothetical protein
MLSVLRPSFEVVKEGRILHFVATAGRIDRIQPVRLPNLYLSGHH